MDVEILEELDRLEVFASAVTVGDPLARLAANSRGRASTRRRRRAGRRRDRSRARTGARHQEVADFAAAVVEDVRAPVGMHSLPRVGMLVQGRAVEVAQPVSVAGKVGRHPVDDHAHVGLVAIVDEVHEVFGRAVAAGRREVAGRLVAPRAVERVLADRHELQVRVAHLVHVVDELLGQLAVVEVAATVFRPLPRAQMHFVNRDRLLEPVGVRPLVHPGAVLPGKIGQLIDDRSRVRRHLGIEGDGIGLFEVAAVVRAKDVLVNVAVLHARDKSGPDARIASPEPILPGLPAVDVADDRDFDRIGRPDGKTGTGGAVNHIGMCSERPIHRTAILSLHDRRVKPTPGYPPPRNFVGCRCVGKTRTFMSCKG